jgi:flagellar biosynthetic protein FlhB
LEKSASIYWMFCWHFPRRIGAVAGGIGLALLIGGWLFSAKALQPNFGRMNPISGLET